MTLAAILGLVQAGVGIWQMFKGSEAGDVERPEYQIPKEATEMLGIARQNANADMPGYQQAISNLQQSDATQYSRASESAGSGSDLLGYLSQRGVTSNRALNQLSAQNAAFKIGQQDKYKQALMAYSGMRDKEFDVNEMQPYMDAMRTSSVMTEGGIQNIFGGISGGLQNYMALDQAKSYQGLLGSQKGYYDMMMEQMKNQQNTGQQTQQTQMGYTPNFNAGFGGLNLNQNSYSGMGLQPGWGGYGQQNNSLMDTYGYQNYYNWFKD